MKKFIRIMGLALVLTLLCASAFAAPSNLSQVEGLPERPEAPTMKTKNDGAIQTVTLSGPLATLNAVAGLEFFPMEFSEDGLTATLDMATLNGQIIGRANSHYYVDGSSWSMWDDYISFSIPNDATEEEAEEIRSNAMAEAEEVIPLDDGRVIIPIRDGIVTYGSEQFYDVYSYDTEDDENTYYYIDRDRNYHTYVYEAAPINGYALAYEGTTADGAVVRYDNYGKLKEIIVTVEGQNYLGSEQAPTKSEVHFEQVTAGNYWNEEQGIWVNGTTTYWVVRSIKEYYTDENGEETFEHIRFAYNGSYDGHVRTEEYYAPKTYENMYRDEGGNG